MQFDDAAVGCAWVRGRADDYVDGSDGALEPRERAAIARHAATCASCRAEIDAAAAILRELRAFPVHEAPEAVIAAAAAAVSAAGRPIPLPRPPRGPVVLRWIPAAAAAAAVVALIATARWSGPVATESSGFAEAGVARAARETVFALSYVNRYARMTGEIITGDVLEKRVVGTMERAVDREIIDRGITPFRRDARRHGIVETEPPHERS